MFTSFLQVPAICGLSPICWDFKKDSPTQLCLQQNQEGISKCRWGVWWLWRGKGLGLILLEVPTLELELKETTMASNEVCYPGTRIVLPTFLDTDLPRRNGHEWNSLVPCKVPSLPNPTTCRGWPHHRGLRPLLFSNSGVGSLTSHLNRSVKVLWDRTYGFSSLSKKTRKSNHLQMSLQRQHFLLSYLKTLSVGPAGLWTRNLLLCRPVLWQLS